MLDSTTVQKKSPCTGLTDNWALPCLLSIGWITTQCDTVSDDWTLWVQGHSPLGNANTQFLICSYKQNKSLVCSLPEFYFLAQKGGVDWKWWWMGGRSLENSPGTMVFLIYHCSEGKRNLYSVLHPDIAHPDMILILSSWMGLAEIHEQPQSNV